MADIDLTKFRHPTNPNFAAPFMTDDGAAATNGYIAIIVFDQRVPDASPPHPTIRGDLHDAVNLAREASATPGVIWTRVADLELPDSLECASCCGAGVIIKADCDDCDGVGEFDHGRHTYFCKECGGSGFIAEPTQPGDGSAEFCIPCYGTGRGYRLGETVHIPGTPGNLNLAANPAQIGLLREHIPDAELAFAPGWKRGQIYVIRFSRGAGVLSTMRTSGKVRHD